MTPPIVHLLDHDEVASQRIALMLADAPFSIRGHRDAAQFLATLSHHDSHAGQPACIVCPIHMADMNAITLHHELLRRDCRLPLILITTTDDAALTVEAMRCGLFNLIERPFDARTLIRALHSALEQAIQPHASERIAQLTRRERQVMELVVAGKYNKTIADVLGINIKTVEQHRSNMMGKLGARNLPELIRLTLGHA